MNFPFLSIYLFTQIDYNLDTIKGAAKADGSTERESKNARQELTRMRKARATRKATSRHSLILKPIEKGSRHDEH